MKTPAILGLLVLALSLGTVIGWIDSRPGWDDTGITIGAVPAWGIALNGSFASLVALPVAVAGAYGGALMRRAVSRGRKPG
jgi:hypothetical protein